MTFDKRLFTILTLFCVLLGSAGMQVSAATNLDDMKDLSYEYYMLQIEPEYTAPENYPEDTPNVLFAHIGRLKNNAAREYKGEITVSLPKEMKNFSVNALGEFTQGEDETTNNYYLDIKDYKLDEKNRTLTWKPTATIKAGEIYNYVLEFFYNPIEMKGAGAKSFTLEVRPQLEVKEMGILIESPAESTDFKVDVEGSTATLSKYGTVANSFVFTDLKADEVRTFPVSYVKEDNKTTQARINDGEWNIPEDGMHGFAQEETGGTATEGTTSSKEPIINTIGAVIIGASVLLGAVLIFVGFLYRGKKAPDAVAEKSAQKAGTQKKSSTSDDKKKLRTQLVNGEIDQATYDREINKLL